MQLVARAVQITIWLQRKSLNPAEGGGEVGIDGVGFAGGGGGGGEIQSSCPYTHTHTQVYIF